jgi:hypothetical protein
MGLTPTELFELRRKIGSDRPNVCNKRENIEKKLVVCCKPFKLCTFMSFV